MKRILSIILAVVYVSVSFAFVAYSAGTVSSVSDGKGWVLDFSAASDGDTVPFTLTNATAEISGGAVNVTATASGTRMVYNGGDFSVSADEIERIVITQKTAVGAYFQPYLFFGGSFNGTNVFKGKAIRGTGDWQDIVINTKEKTIFAGETDATSADMPAGLNWSGTINAFRLDNWKQSTPYSIKSVKFLKAVVDGKADDEGWTIDFTDASDGADFAGSFRNATGQIKSGALTIMPATKDSSYTSAGTNFSVVADNIKEIRVKVKLPAAATQIQMFFTPTGGSIQNFGKVQTSTLADLGDGWKEYVVDTSTFSAWAGTIASFRFDVDYVINTEYSIGYIKFLAESAGATEYVEGVKSGTEWCIDFSVANDGAVPVINAHGTDSINTNATYTVSDGALQVEPMNSTTSPRIAVSNRSNFSVDPAYIDKIVFKVRSATVLKTAQLYFTTESGSFNHGRVDAVIGNKDSDGWQEVIFYPHDSVGWDSVVGDITKFRFDLNLRVSQTCEVQSIKFETLSDNEQSQCSVTFDGDYHTSAVTKRGAADAPVTNPEKEGYSFYGWAEKGTSDAVTFPRIITEDTEFTSLWIADRFSEANTPRAWRFFEEKEPVKDYAYSFCVVGDTQDIIDEHPDKFHYIYDWIIDNKEEKNIEFVFGLGDITQNSNVDEEWQVAQEHINRLNGVVPYSLVRGSENHDSSAKFNEYFNKPVYTDTLEGFYDEAEINNAWRTFAVGGVDYLFLMLDFGASDEVLEWAGEVIEQHPYHRVIISTHCYLYSDGSTVDYSDDSPPHKTEVGDGTKNNGDEMWDKLISQHENIFMVLCGHISSDEIVVAQTEGIHGNTVTQILIDHQRVDNADTPAGIVAMLYFSEDGKSVEVECISTIENMYYMAENQFSLEIPPYIGPTCIKAYDNDTATVYAREPGEYSVIFADYDGDMLNNAEIVKVTLSKGETKTVARKNTSYTLGEGDMVMMWKDMINIVPACESLPITK